MAEGRGALMSLLTQVRGSCCEGRLARATGASSRENVGMSNEKVVRTHLAGSLRVPPLCQSSEG